MPYKKRANFNKVWTPKDEQRLTDMTNEGKQIPEIANTLDRSLKSIQMRQQKLGLDDPEIQHRNNLSMYPFATTPPAPKDEWHNAEDYEEHLASYNHHLDDQKQFQDIIDKIKAQVEVTR